MIYTKETAMEIGRRLNMLDWSKQRDAIAAAPLEAQAEAVQMCGRRADDPWMQDNAAHLRAEAKKLREG